MAKFTKLNIGDSVASGGGRVFKKLSTMTIPTEQLPPPYAVTIDGNTLTWGDYSALATNFDILVDGVVSANTAEQSFPLSYFGFSDGTYSISVVSKAEGYLDSDPSEAVSYTVAAEDELVGTWILNTTLVYANSTFGCDVEGEAHYGASAIASPLNRITVRSSNAACTLYGNPSTSFYNNFYDSTRNGSNVYTLSGGTNGATVGKTTSNGVLLRTFTIKSIDNSQSNYETLKTWLKANATKQ